ncbi:PaaI family thioesterase [Williamsia deligens]|uniref:Acyl-coenzyme A thioesterase THEM4 n=1 Tax=Williamsia deligens TaxID=321325 RepID=A0ABW3G252_9NOCA|nr:PaaI family thioesterase [Williamsia deligens]MCP2194538.1 Acyl-coenzyme A thioesterase PaaI, contains HGG motif [Williamsia deligens]
MSESGTGPDGDGHGGGFRTDMAISTDRGGPRFGEMIEVVRHFMDRVRAAEPSEALVERVIEQLTELNTELEAVAIDEWQAPSGTRIDLPARGNITLPPYVVHSADATGVAATVRFTRFHLGGNNAAHGGYIAMAFDDLLGMTGALATGKVTRTAYLTVNYRSITPLYRELTVRTAVDRIDGRKIFVTATIHDGDRLCAEADGLFVALKPGQP